MPSLSAAFVWVIFPILVVEVLSSRRMSQYVRGSRQRYWWATVHRASQWFVVGYFLVAAMFNAASGDWADAVGDFVVIVLRILLNHFFPGDDDDFWNDARKKLVRTLSGLVPRRRVPASVSA